MAMTIEQLMEKINERIDEKLKPLTVQLSEVDNKLTKIQDRPEGTKEDKWKDICERVKIILRAQMLRDPVAVGILQKADWLNETTGSEGGYLVPVEFSDQIFTLAEDYGVVRRDAFPVPMKTATKKMPIGLTGIEMTYPGEGGLKSLAKPSFGQVELVARTASGVIALTNDILDDSGPDLVAYLNRLMPASIAKREDVSAFFGNGGTIPGLVNTISPDSIITVPASGSTLEDITADDLNKMKYAVSGAAATGAKFYCNRSLLGVLERLKDEQGRYIVRTPMDGTPQSIWGHQIATTDAFPVSPEPGDIVAVFGNLQNLYHGQRAELAILPSYEAAMVVYEEDGVTLKDVISAFQRNLRFVRFEIRHDFKAALGSAFACLQLRSS